MLIGYARVSTVDQNLALQRDALTEDRRFLQLRPDARRERSVLGLLPEVCKRLP